MTILQAIHAWSKGLPVWQQDAIARIYASRDLNAEVVGDLYALAKSEAGIEDPDSDDTHAILAVAKVLPDDLLAPFLAIARAAQAGRPCPDDDELAVIYGTSSPGRIRRLLEHYEKTGLIVVRTDFSGRRSVSIPDLGLATEPLEA